MTLLGGIGISPQLPLPPALILAASVATAPCIGLVLGGNVLVGRANQLLVDGVAGHAVLGLGQCFVGLGLTGHHDTRLPPSGQHKQLSFSRSVLIGLVGKSDLDDKTLFYGLANPFGEVVCCTCQIRQEYNATTRWRLTQKSLIKGGQSQQSNLPK